MPEPDPAPASKETDDEEEEETEVYELADSEEDESFWGEVVQAAEEAEKRLPPPSDDNMDRDPTRVELFNGTDLPANFKIDALNRGLGRGLGTPTESLLSFHRLVDRWRQVENTEERQLRYGKTADEDAKQDIMLKPAVRAAFYAIFVDVADPDRDVNEMYKLTFDWLWNADTARRFNPAKSRFNCHAEANTQQTTRGKVSRQKKSEH